MRSFIPALIKLVIFLVVTSVATYVLAATIANTSFGSTYTYKANFSDATGIEDGDDVRIAGVRVGTIEGISLIKNPASPDHRLAQLTFTVVKSRPLPASAQAILRYRNLVGQRYLDIEQGNPGDSTAMLKPGSTIQLQNTQPAVDLTVLFQGFQPLIKGLDATEINELSNEIVLSLQGESGAIDNLFSTVADLTNSLADKDQVIDSVITNLTSTLQTVAAHDDELSDLITQLRAFVAGLAQDRQTIGEAIDGVNNLTTTTAGLLTQVRQPLAKDIKDLTGLVGALNAHSSDIQYVVDQLAPTVAGLIRTADYGSWFNFYLCSVNGFITVGGVQHNFSLPNSKQARCN